MKGKVTRIVPNRPYAFVRSKSGIDHFLHRDEFVGDWDAMRDAFIGGKPVDVTFTPVENGEKGMRANNCKLFTDEDYNV